MHSAGHAALPRATTYIVHVVLPPPQPQPSPPQTTTSPLASYLFRWKGEQELVACGGPDLARISARASGTSDRDRRVISTSWQCHATAAGCAMLACAYATRRNSTREQRTTVSNTPRTAADLLATGGCDLHFSCRGATGKRPENG